MIGVEAPGPLHGAGAEDERAAGGAVEREAVRRAAVAVGGAVVLQDVEAALGRRRQVDEARRARAVVEVRIPLVAQRAVRQRRLGARRQVGDAGVAPEAQLAGVGRDADRAGARVDHEDGARERVLGLGPLRVEGATVAPRPRPLTGGVDMSVLVGLLVGDERAVRRVRAVDARLPARAPEHLVAAEEGEVDARVARGLDVRALGAGPVLVVTRGHEDLVVADQRSEAIGVDPGLVADVVAVALQPADHRVLGVEDPVLAARDRAGDEGPVVADHRGAGGAAA